MLNGFSIIICTFNGYSRLGQVLKHIEELVIPDGLMWQVIIVDNASSDNTFLYLQNDISLQKWAFSICVIKESKPGLNFARLAGLRYSNFNWILFCDDDNLLDKNYIRFWFDVVSRDPEIGSVGGKGFALSEDCLPHWFANYSHSYAVGSQLTDSGIVPYGGALYGAGLFVKKNPILNLVNNGFDMIMSDRTSANLSSGGDLELCYIIHLSGFKLYYEEKMIFYHQISNNRLEWSYYIQLKRGIASGAGLLAPYQFIFTHGYKNVFCFLLTYLFLTLRTIFVFLYVLLKYVLISKNRMDIKTDLALVILREKSISYFSNFRKAKNHYSSLLKQFSATF